MLDWGKVLEIHLLAKTHNFQIQKRWKNLTDSSHTQQQLQCSWQEIFSTMQNVSPTYPHIVLCFSFCWRNHLGHLYCTSSYSKPYFLAIWGMKSCKQFRLWNYRNSTKSDIKELTLSNKHRVFVERYSTNTKKQDTALKMQGCGYTFSTARWKLFGSSLVKWPSSWF